MIRKCEHVSSILRRWKEGYSVAPRHLFVYKSRTLCLIKGEGGPRAARQADVIHKCGVSPMLSVPAGAAYSSQSSHFRLPSVARHKEEKKKRKKQKFMRQLWPLARGRRQEMKPSVEGHYIMLVTSALIR
jgi:hypothetical protein